MGRENALGFIGKGSIVPEITRFPDYGSRFSNFSTFSHNISTRGTVPADYRSSLYQWLPANVAFRDDGTAKITSYINNLHPGKHPAIYEAIEHAIDAAIPAWDQCLRENLKYRDDITAGRSQSRFDLITEATCVSPGCSAFVTTNGKYKLTVYDVAMKMKICGQRR